MKEISFIVYGIPKPKARARTVRLKNGKSASYTPRDTADWEASIQLQVLDSRPQNLFDGALALYATFFLPRPRSIPKRRQYPETKPDLDNLIKSVTDALEGLIYTNDSRIVRKTLAKEYGDPPRVEVTIRPLEGMMKNDSDRAVR